MKKHVLEWLMPEFPRIPHLPLDPNASEDDIIAPESELDDLLDGHVEIQEKIDGANCAITWTEDGIFIRNRTHILNKGYESKTTSKKQFLSLWTWAESRETREKIASVMDFWRDQPVSIYGEWVLVKHGTEYDNLPEKFIAYAVYIPEKKHWSRHGGSDVTLETAGFEVPYTMFDGQLSSIEHLKGFMNQPSAYSKSGQKAEGIIIHSGYLGRKIYKMVRSDYQSNLYWDNKNLIKQPCWK